MARQDELLSQIFYEGHVIDFDFSKWDRFIRLVVVARGLEGENGRHRTFNVDFYGVCEISWASNCVDLNLQTGHAQWTIMDHEIVRDNGFIRLILPAVGSGPEPTMKIKCREIETSEISPSIIDEINPNWNRPYGPLARGSIDEIYKSIKLR